MLSDLRCAIEPEAEIVYVEAEQLRRWEVEQIRDGA
jgi:hypothetical protein